jgi:hypothetical protein
VARGNHVLHVVVTSYPTPAVIGIDQRIRQAGIEPYERVVLDEEELIGAIPWIIGP